MEPAKIIIPVRLDARTFKRFSRFDTFSLRRRWVRPAVFALILLGFAFLALLSRRPQAGMIVAVLLAVGLGLPLIYIGTYFSQVNAQVLQRGLDSPRHVYTVTLDFDGLRVETAQRKESPLVMKWPDVQAAFRAKGCVYLYANAARAFLLPDGQASVDDDALWAYLEAHMGDRCRSRSRRPA